MIAPGDALRFSMVLPKSVWFYRADVSGEESADVEKVEK
jgi:hypothetical protein